MRRNEVITTLMESIGDHFPDDAARQFRPDGLTDAARALQDLGKDDYGSIDNVIRDVVTDTSGRVMDDLADGEITDPGKWLYEQVRG